ncbi:class I SAM-dependent methyltransferase [Candidatus Pelagibacter sp.]|nr:class I SAM-dependent methyltransferase [Candidatus Pelagibacter sp.]
MRNIHKETVKSFGDEWHRFDQSKMENKESLKIFKSYFSIFPLKKLTKFSEGFDMGCGSGRWAKFVAPKVKYLNCIDPSQAIEVAKKNLKKFKNIKYYQKSLDKSGLKMKSQDFGYSLGVLHHVPDTKAAIISCSKLLKPGAPFLLYIYYYFDNRPSWFKFLWALSNLTRLIIYRLPKSLKFLICDIIAILIYYPFARTALIFEKIGLKFKNFPLNIYKNLSFYVMRTDARDRFGTPLEKRFTKKDIYQMMKDADFEKINFRDAAPFWTVVGFKKR